MPRPPSSTHVAVVWNPRSIRESTLRDAITRAGASASPGETQWFQTSPDDPGQGAARSALATSPRAVIVAGGDGTVRAVAEVASTTDVPLVIVPTGTGNLLARNLHVPRGDVDAAVGAVTSGRSRRIDVGLCELERPDGTRAQHAFLVMTGIGLDASMATNTNLIAKKHLGWLAYSAPIAMSVFRNQQIHLHYKIDGARTRPLRAHTIIVGNCGSLTAGMLLLPDAVVDDGLLDIVTLRPKGFGGWAMIGTRLSSNGVLHRSRVGRAVATLIGRGRSMEHTTAREIQVRFNRPQSIEIDGDDFGSVSRLRITVRERSLHLIVP